LNLTTGVATGKNKNDTITGSTDRKVTKEGYIIDAARPRLVVIHTHNKS